MPKEYTIEEKMAGKDLHGLSCRVPKPTAAQEKCSHTRREWVDTSYENGDGEMVEEGHYAEITTCEDIPGTNNFRCRLCGYTRRY